MNKELFFALSRENLMPGLLNCVSAWFLNEFGSFVKRWLVSVREHAVPLYHEYVEGMISDYIDERRKWRSKGRSELQILLLSIPWGISILLGICRLKVCRFRRGISLLAYGAEQFFSLSHSLTPLSLHGQMMKYLLGWLHRMTGSVGVQANKIEVRLSSATAQVTAWSQGAEAVLGFSADEVLHQPATASFVPETESSGRSLVALLQSVCTVPESHSLNINENRDCNGDRYWILWVNVPIYSATKELIEVSCVGIKIEDPTLMKLLVQAWKVWHKLFIDQ
jgi:hypothetical protein